MSASTLRFVADESCDFAVVRALRAEGYDVLAVAEVAARSDDRQVIERASDDNRILLTEDKDFGWLVFASQAESAGVILIRFPGKARQVLVHTITELIRAQGQELIGAFVVCSQDMSASAESLPLRTAQLCRQVEPLSL
jgi:predicted nuclease of predicted toxin-antitoxin system